MNENKGYNFLVGILGLWLLYMAYSHGLLHQIGFMAINKVQSTQLVYGDSTTSTTPLAVFANFLIEAVTAFGYLLILISSGLWSGGLVAAKYIKDLFNILTNKIKDSQVLQKKDQTVNIVETNTPTIPTESASNLEMILEAIKDTRSRLASLEDQFLKQETKNVVE